MKIRLHSTKEDIEKFIQILKKNSDIKILMQSEPYFDRGKSIYERVYLDIKFYEKTI